MNKRVINAGRLTAAWGEWPNFHDGEILRILLDRCGPSMTADIQLRRLAADGRLDETGHFLVQSVLVVTLKLEDINEDVTIEEFNHQNVIQQLYIQETNEGLVVDIKGIFGASVKVTCARLVVANVTEVPALPDVGKNFRD